MQILRKLLFWVTVCPFLWIVACDEPNKTVHTEEPAIEPKSVNANTLGMNALEPADPNFGRIGDTISSSGPKSITRSILQDKKGNLWLASWEGIIRFDGQKFTNFTLKEGLRHYHVFSAFEDKRGVLWFGMVGGGLYRYDGQSFTLFTTADGLANNNVMCTLEDDLGNLWFGTGAGVSRYDGRTFTNFTTELGLVSTAINTIVQDKTGSIWIGSQDGLCRYDGNRFNAFPRKEGLAFYNVRCILEDKAGIIWIGHEDGLYRYDGQLLQKLNANFTGNIMEDKRGHLWLAESQSNVPGMHLTRYDGKTFHKIASSTQVFGIAEDGAGTIWYGTAFGTSRYEIR